MLLLEFAIVCNAVCVTTKRVHAAKRVCTVEPRPTITHNRNNSHIVPVDIDRMRTADEAANTMDNMYDMIMPGDLTAADYYETGAVTVMWH